jgi:hypothetical protein
MTRKVREGRPMRPLPEERPQYVLRNADLDEMIADGSWKQQHFLIQILAQRRMADAGREPQ